MGFAYLASLLIFCFASSVWASPVTEACHETVAGQSESNPMATWKTSLRLDEKERSVRRGKGRIITLRRAHFTILKAALGPETVINKERFSEQTGLSNLYIGSQLNTFNASIGLVHRGLELVLIPEVGYYWSEKPAPYTSYESLRISSDPTLSLVWVRDSPGVLALTSFQFSILRAIAESTPKPIFERQLLRRIWPNPNDEPQDSKARLASQVARLNEILLKKWGPQTPYIVHLENIGYVLSEYVSHKFIPFESRLTFKPGSPTVKWDKSEFTLTKEEHALLNELIFSRQYDLSEDDIFRLAFNGDGNIAKRTAVKQLLSSLIRKFRAYDSKFNEIRATPHGTVFWKERAIGNEEAKSYFRGLFHLSEATGQ